MPPAAKYRRLRLTLLAGLLGAGLAILVGIVVLMWLARDSVPPLSESDLTAAEERWRQNGPGSYDATIRITGTRAGEVRYEVRDGEVVAMQRDGVSPAQRRTWDAWTVPNLFDTVHTEIEAAETPERGFGAPPDARVILRAEFDDQYGYPVRYERHVLGTELAMGWEFIDFQPRLAISRPHS
jgi:hypothetical protein